MKQEDLDQHLGDLDEIHNPQEVPEGFGGRVNLPDATYQVQLAKIYIDKSQSSGRLQTIIKFTVINGEQKNNTISKYCGMESAQNLDYLTSDLRTLGIKQKFTWKDVYKLFNDLLDKYYEITLVTKKGFQAVYINKEIKISKNNSEQPKPFIGEKGKDDIPF
jgi:hypothetical protein